MNPVPLFFPLVAGASHATESLTFFETLLESNIVNIAIAACLIILLIRKFNVGDMLQKSRNKLKTEIELLENERQQAEEKLAALKQQSMNLDHEIASILGQAKDSAEAISRQILETARADAERLVEMGKHRIEAEHKTAAKELEKRLLADALQDARMELAQNLTSDGQKRSVEEFIQELSRSHNI